MKYKSLSLRKIYVLAAALCAAYILICMICFIFSGLIFSGIGGAHMKELHPDAFISGKNIFFLCISELVWCPFLLYTVGCVDAGYSAKRCKRTFRAAPLLWLGGFLAEHALSRVISQFSSLSHQSARWMIHSNEYFTFFFGILHIAALVLVCTSAALGIDEVRHFNHMR